MRRGDTEELIRLLAGELPPAAAAALSARIGREPELAAAFRRLEEVWRAADPAPAADGSFASVVPPGFAVRVMARVRREAAGAAAPAALSWSAAPLPVRAAGAAALAAGLVLGAGLATLRVSAGVAGVSGAAVPVPPAAAEAAGGSEELPGGLLAPSLADAYFEAVATEEGAGADPLAGRGVS
jgi:anti-sigma factor RsiW